MTNPKLRIFLLRDFFWKRTDEAHPASVQQMLAYLAVYGICPERRTLYADIRLLREAGMDIVKQRSRTQAYYLASRDFELAELKLLVDAVQSSRFLTAKKSQLLIGKLANLVSEQDANALSRQVYVQNRVKTGNERIYYNVDSIHRAVQTGRKISFLYCQYTMEKKLAPRHDGAVYEVSPYLLTWAEDNYYLIGDGPRHAGLVHYRVDKMTEVRVRNEARAPLPACFDPVDYAKSMFSMYAGEREWVVLSFDRSLVGVVLDRFGTDVSIVPADGNTFTVSVCVSVSPAFFAWLLQFGADAEILRPASVRAQMAALLDGARQRYEKPLATHEL